MFEFFEKIAEGIGFKLVSDFSDRVIDWIKEVKKNAENKDDENNIATSGDWSKVATSGDESQVATSGYRSKVATSGDESQVATSGYRSKVATSGDESQVATSGDESQVATSGYRSKVATSGDWSKVATSGDESQVATSGDESQVATSGYRSKVATSGDWSKVEISGDNSVGFACGLDSIIKAKNGTWISLCEYSQNENDNWIPSYALSAQIGNEEYKDFKGRTLKETEFYCLVHKNFYPVDLSDGIKTIKVSEKKRQGITIIRGLSFNDYKTEVYVVKDGELSAHGRNLKEAMEDLTYKKLKNKNVKEVVEEIKKSGKVTKARYRAITGACWLGMEGFCKKHNITTEEIELDELRKILINDYGSEKFWNLIDEEQ